ncbi:hypothetical protein AB0F25_12865 [Streptomyces wedmorensis]|uniref:hypothetical protein n=1 Tax=Streptomyces wedmorensis TaxID=43759 RepID=UPI00343AB9FF
MVDPARRGAHGGLRAAGRADGLCREIDYGQSLYVHVKVVYEDGGTALVHLTSFDV